MANIIYIGENSLHNYNKEQYKTGIIGTSDCNAFVPLYSLFAHELILFDEGELIKVMEYSVPSLPNPNLYERQYAGLLSHLRTGVYYKRYKFKIRGEEHFICMHRGLLYIDNKILMCLGVDTEYVLNTPIDQISSTPDTTKFTLFINNEFDTSILWKNIRKKVESMYVSPLKAQGVDVVFTSKINNWLFKNNFKQPKFKSVIEMMKHLEEVPKTLIME